MLSASELYQKQDEKRLSRAWGKFEFFSPSLSVLSSTLVRRAIGEGDRGVFLKQAQANHFPDDSLEDGRRRFIEAANRGIGALNKLCLEHIKEPDLFILDPLGKGVDFLNLATTAKERWIEARDGRHEGSRPISREGRLEISKAYKSVESVGLANRVLMIDNDPLFQIAESRHPLILDRFRRMLGLERAGTSNHPDFEYIWKAGDNISMYGDEDSPFRSRIKGLDEEGNPRYGSILIKMLAKGDYLGAVRDRTGIEIIVENPEERDRLLGKFRAIRGGGKFENFKSGAAGRGEHSSGDHYFTKFVFRTPIKTGSTSGGLDRYERVPVEVQILTLDAHNERNSDPAISHGEYRERQFGGVFPAFYPKEIYGPLIS